MAPTHAARTKKACSAMKQLGIPEAKVRPVLKTLRENYDDNWTFIEEEGYKVLVDAIFDVCKDAEVTENEKKEEVKKSNDVPTNRGKKKAIEQSQLVLKDEDDELEEEETPLRKRLRRKRDNNTSLSLGSPVSKKAREEEPKPEAENEDNDMIALPPLKRYLRRRGERGSAISSQAPPVIYLPAGPLHTENNSGALVIFNNDSFTEHKPMIPDTENCSSAPMLEMEKSNLLVEEQNEEPEVTTSMDVPSSTVEESSEHKVAAAALELASSTSGEAKISLTFEPATGETFSRLPSMEDLRRAMEEKCLKSYKIVLPGFSVLGFMKDMCSCYIDLAKNSNNQSLETETVSDLTKAGEESGATEMSMDLVVVPECKISAEGWKAISNVKDIAVGEENVKIPWVNEINDEVPSHFRYMPQSYVFQDAVVKFSLSSFSDKQCCSPPCIEDCLVSATPCNCAVDNGFAYTVDGVLKEDFLEERISEACDQRKQVMHFCKECPLEKARKEEILEPCKGHLQRKAIKECWIKCGCAKRCGNRMVQRGINKKLQVFFTPNGKGWGLRTVERLPKGTFVCEYMGEVLTISELYQRSLEDKVTTSVLLDARWGSEECLEDNKALCLDGTRYGNISRFLNHRCLDANLIEIPVHVETPAQHYYHVAFFTTRDIAAMEELTWDYGVDFDDDDYPMKPFDCLCGSRFCRSVKRSRSK